MTHLNDDDNNNNNNKAASKHLISHLNETLQGSKVLLVLSEDTKNAVALHCSPQPTKQRHFP